MPYLVLALFILFFPGNALGYEDKTIVISLPDQLGGAYKNGRLVDQFEVMTGDDEKPTPTGEFRIREKAENYHSRKYDAPMPYSLFFTEENHAIHARGIKADLPPRSVRRDYASHGCISTDYSVLSRWLFDWADIGTKVIIIGERTGD